MEILNKINRFNARIRILGLFIVIIIINIISLYSASKALRKWGMSVESASLQGKISNGIRELKGERNGLENDIAKTLLMHKQKELEIQKTAKLINNKRRTKKDLKKNIENETNN